MDPWTVVAVVLLAVLVGAALPVLFEAHRTLRASRRAILRLEEDLVPAIREVRRTAAHANEFGRAWSPHAREVAEVLEAVAGLARPIRDLRANLVTLATWAATLAPAVAAAAKAYKGRDESPPPDGEATGRHEHDADTVTSDGR